MLGMPGDAEKPGVAGLDDRADAWAAKSRVPKCEGPGATGIGEESACAGVRSALRGGGGAY